jgi:LacI family repressor for deo operon, udp, cdd, tsx, nupC, and nupG
MVNTSARLPFKTDSSKPLAEQLPPLVNSLRENDYRIPEDMSVIGFDDISYASLVSPKLTTIRQPLEQIGKICMQVLLAQMKGKPPLLKYVELPFELVVRQSTGCAPTTNEKA